MDETSKRTLRRIHDGNTVGIRRKFTTSLQSAGLVQRLDGVLKLTPKGASALNAWVFPDSRDEGFHSPEDDR